MTITISALEMRKKLGGILDRVYKKGDHVTITRGNTPLVTLIPASEHQEMFEKKDRLQTVNEVIDRIRQRREKNPEQFEGWENSVEAVRKMRDSRW